MHISFRGRFLRHMSNRLIHSRAKSLRKRHLLRNRLKIVWCTRLARAEDEEKRKKIEEKMLGSGPKLDESGVDGDRERRGLADSDADSGWLKVQRLLLDLENLAFHQGGLLMVNKKCELPLESYRNHKDMKKFMCHL
ncbi:hypothetical protein HYC85_017357 [Camellia sinensis]|uniref:Brr2 N-terminal helicase PWI domain-containing protein n=1 Tax=Camellia sinensis TaxID=4442 RepID=A0A7J7H2E2_CAMSI|nr:hypothetical protein HYC85_017357 [Camellia sinensis]